MGSGRTLILTGERDEETGSTGYDVIISFPVQDSNPDPDPDPDPGADVFEAKTG